MAEETRAKYDRLPACRENPDHLPACQGDQDRLEAFRTSSNSQIVNHVSAMKTRTGFSLQRMLSYSNREARELSRDPIRLTLAGLGSVMLMFIMGYGITMDVEGLTFAVLDRDQTTTSRDYTLSVMVSMAPAVIPLLLLMIPVMLTSLSIVREKRLGSIINFFATPTTRLEFLLGKQIPYIFLGMVNGALLVAMAVYLFGVPLTGNLLALMTGTLLYVACATAMGLLISTFTSSQIAANFGTAVLTMLPATTLSGLIDPTTSLEGFGRLVSYVYPTTHYVTIVRGTLSKELGVADLTVPFCALLIACPVMLIVTAMLLKKQEVRSCR